MHKHGYPEMDIHVWISMYGFQWMDITVSGNQYIQLNESTSNFIGTGASNSSIIINSQGIGSDAASMCSLLDLNGYDDWFLPSLNELWEINSNRELISSTAIQNSGEEFDFGFYWSSVFYIIILMSTSI